MIKFILFAIFIIKIQVEIC